MKRLIDNILLKKLTFHAGVDSIPKWSWNAESPKDAEAVEEVKGGTIRQHR